MHTPRSNSSMDEYFGRYPHYPLPAVTTRAGPPASPAALLQLPDTSLELHAPSGEVGRSGTARRTQPPPPSAPSRTLRSARAVWDRLHGKP